MEFVECWNLICWVLCLMNCLQVFEGEGFCEIKIEKDKKEERQVEDNGRIIRIRIITSKLSINSKHIRTQIEI